MAWWIVALDTISAHDVSVKIFRRFRAKYSCPHHKKKNVLRAVLLLGPLAPLVLMKRQQVVIDRARWNVLAMSHLCSRAMRNSFTNIWKTYIFFRETHSSSFDSLFHIGQLRVLNLPRKLGTFTSETCPVGFPANCTTYTACSIKGHSMISAMSKWLHSFLPLLRLLFCAICSGCRFSCLHCQKKWRIRGACKSQWRTLAAGCRQLWTQCAVGRVILHRLLKWNSKSTLFSSPMTKTSCAKPWKAWQINGSKWTSKKRHWQCHWHPPTFFRRFAPTLQRQSRW